MIKEKKHLLYGNTGVVEKVRIATDIRENDGVFITLEDGRTCVVEPSFVRRA